jgi:hypothetical protein
MKRTKLAFLAVVLIAVCSAFATVKPTLADAYYFDEAQQIFVIVQGEENIDWRCVTEVTKKCLYQATVANPNPANPAHFEVIPGREDKRFELL